MLKQGIAFVGLIFLSACGAATTVVTQDVDVPVNVYPNLPDVPAVPTPQIFPVQFIAPTDSQGNALPYSQTAGTPVTTNTTPASCSTSNIYLGLDQENYTHLMIDLQAFHNYATESNSRIASVNAERAQWRAQNAANTTTPATTAKSSTTTATTGSK
jgi:hypothetical protein